ncbi:MAG TPA: MarR family transcriptional regulator [Acidimicrobiales bacterium]
MSSHPRPPSRRALLDALAEAGRSHSDATVLFHATVADRIGINPTDHKVMSILERHGPLSAGEIARRTGLASASITALLDRLERRGFVRRRADAADRRRVIVEAAPDGIARFAPYFARRRESLGKLYDAYSDEELTVILDFLQRSTERLHLDLDELGELDEVGEVGEVGEG